MASDNLQADLVRNLLAVLFIGVLIAASFWIMRPFFTSHQSPEFTAAPSFLTASPEPFSAVLQEPSP